MAIDHKTIEPQLKETPSRTDDATEEELALAQYVPESDAEKKLRRKVDLIMLPTLWIMCVLCYIDRNNIVSSASPVTTVVANKQRATPMQLV